MSESAVFSIMPVEVWRDRRLTLEQVRVLGALLSFRARNTDLVWPKREQIAERCGMHVSNVSQATSALVKLGWLVKDGKGGFSQATKYRVCVPDTVADSATVAERATVADSARSTVADSARSTVADSATRKEETIEHTNELTILTSGSSPTPDPEPPRRQVKTSSVLEVLTYLNRQARRSYQLRAPDGKTLTKGAKLIADRLRQGYTVEQCKDVIGEKSNQWMGDPKMDQFLRPSTLFTVSNFEQYLAEAQAGEVHP